MATITNIKPDQILYCIQRQKMGNTSVSIGSLYKLKVIEVDLDKNRVLASWNGNPPRYFYKHHIKQWKVNKPQPKHSVY